MDYMALDDAIEAESEAGNNTLHTLDVKLTGMGLVYAPVNTRSDRVIGRRLQAMKRKGRLAYDKSEGIWRKRG